MEQKRVFDKNTFWVIVVLCLLNVFGYLYSQISGGLAVGAENFWDYAAEYRQVIAENRNDPQKAENYRKFHDLESLSYSDYRGRVYREVLRQWEYVESYDTLLDQMDEQVRQLSSISIFADTESESYKGMLKTQRDLTALRGQNLTVGFDRITQSMLDYREMHFFSLIFILYFVFRLMGEQKQGLWSIINSTAKGRWQLVLNRAFCLFAALLLYHASMVLSEFFCSVLLYGDLSELGRIVQSIESLQYFPYPVAVASFWFWYIGVSVMGSYVLALVLWSVLVLSHSWMMGLGIYGSLFGLEYLVWRSLSEGSRFLALKYVNLFCCLNPARDLKEYGNVGIGERLVSCQLLFGVSMLVTAGLLVILLAVLALIQKNNFIVVQVRIPTFLSSRQNRKKSPVFPIWMIEIKRLVLCKFGLLSLAVIGLLFYIRMKPEQIYYSEKDNIINQFCSEYGNLDNSLGKKYIADLEKQVNTERELFLTAKEQWQKGEITSEEYTERSSRWESFTGIRSALEQLLEQQAYLERLEAQRGIAGKFVNPRGYQYLIGDEGRQMQTFTAIGILAIQILLYANSYAEEKRSGFWHLAHSTPRGGRFWFGQKRKAILISTVFLWLGMTVLDLADVSRTYGLEGLEAPVQSIEFLCDVEIQCSLWAYLGIAYAIKLILLLECAGMMASVSVFCTAVGSVLAGGLLFLLPPAIASVGIPFLGSVSVIQYLCIADAASMSSSLWAAVLFGVVELGIRCFAGKRWCKTC